MNNLVCVSMAMMGALCWAQNPYPLMADVPFDFTVAGMTMPAGHYRVSQDAFAGVITLSEERSHKRVVVQTVAAETVDASDNARLVFRRYGDQYFLAETWTTGSNIGRRIPPSKQERQLAIRAPAGRAIIASK